MMRAEHDGYTLLASETGFYMPRVCAPIKSRRSGVRVAKD
jgi:hypothetical protein